MGEKRENGNNESKMCGTIIWIAESC